MQSFRFTFLWATLLAPAALLAQNVTTSGTITLSGGSAIVNNKGDRPAYQQLEQHSRQGFVGIEDYSLVREGKDSVFKFDARILPGDEDYRLKLRYEKNERYYVDAGYEQFRVWYDGSAGYFTPKNLSFRLYDEELTLDRSRLWLEAGFFTENQTLIRFRYDYRARSGNKDSSSWGDTTAGTYGARNIVPTLYELDEQTHAVSLDVGNDTQEAQKWNVGARYSETKLDNKRYTRRQPFAATDRTVTTKDATESDLFAAHGYYLRKINDQLTISGGALITSLDTVLDGSRIYGQGYDPVFDPVSIHRQWHDEGFYKLEGNANLSQTVLNLNAVYTPRKDLTIRPSVRFENTSEDAHSAFVETAVGNAPRFVTAVEELEGENNKDWSEFTESVEVRYTGKPNWTFSGAGEWVQGTGNLEEGLGEPGALSIDRASDLARFTQKYSFSAKWYAKPGLSFAAQYYYKLRMNDYNILRDNTPPTGGDRYPAYIIDQDFETHDLNVRMSWRATSKLSLVSRYDHQESKINNVQAGLGSKQSADSTSDIISQNITFSPTARLYLTGSVNVTYDQLKTPAYPIVQQGDNNYINGSLGGGYVVSQKDDLYADYSWFNASNFYDNSATSLPYGLSQRQQAASLTWVRRQSESLIYTFKYGYITNRDTTFGGMNDFNAHVLYAKVQLHF